MVCHASAAPAVRAALSAFAITQELCLAVRHSTYLFMPAVWHIGALFLYCRGSPSPSRWLSTVEAPGYYFAFKRAGAGALCAISATGAMCAGCPRNGLSSASVILQPKTFTGGLPCGFHIYSSQLRRAEKPACPGFLLIKNILIRCRCYFPKK